MAYDSITHNINSKKYCPSVDFLLGDSGCKTNSENEKDLFQESNANGDRLV